METNKVKNTINFTGYMTRQHVDMIRHINPKNIERFLKKDKIIADFKNTKLAAGLTIYATRIFKKLRISRPPQILVHKFHHRSKSLQETYLSKFTTKKGEKISKLAVTFSKKNYSISPKIFDKMCNKMEKAYGTKHFMAITLHEFMHKVLFQKALKQLQRSHRSLEEKLKEMAKVSIRPFKKEIREKIGTYATVNALELHATYWAKEICQSLDGNLLPKYNALKNPQTELSKPLRDFITAYSKGHFKKAAKISQEARKIKY